MVSPLQIDVLEITIVSPIISSGYGRKTLFAKPVRLANTTSKNTIKFFIIFLFLLFIIYFNDLQKLEILYFHLSIKLYKNDKKSIFFNTGWLRYFPLSYTAPPSDCVNNALIPLAAGDFHLNNP